MKLFRISFMPVRPIEQPNLNESELITYKFNLVILGIVTKEFVGETEITYPVEVIQTDFSDTANASIHLVPCNLSSINQKIDRYSILIKKSNILYSLGYDFIVNDNIKKQYQDYLKLQNFQIDRIYL